MHDLDSQADQRILDANVNDDPPAPLRFERRCNDRWTAQGLATAHCAAGERFGERFTLHLIDASTDGLGARVDRPLNPGTIVTVAFAGPGQGVKNGTVVRCLPCGNGYRLAIRFEMRLAA